MLLGDVCTMLMRRPRCAAAVRNAQLQIPDWVDVVKTACFKELPPLDRDWYYIRAGEGPVAEEGALAGLQGQRRLARAPAALGRCMSHTVISGER
jgi:hypothetical protein